MKRGDALAQLSRDHHHGLVVAQQLRRATPATAAGARDGFLTFWYREGHEHFRIEEDVLLPALARHHPPTDTAVIRVLTDHVDLRRRAADLVANAGPTPEDLHELGDRLQAHIRHEERVLFPLIESALPDNDLAELAAALEKAEQGRLQYRRLPPVAPPALSAIRRSARHQATHGGGD
jgi:iron-sulfur cluster repair protein YtfE (RIC family)